MRDARVVKQDLDYSCGATALATLLNEFYGLKTLKQLDTRDGEASFANTQRSLPYFDFKAQGFTSNYEQLTDADSTLKCII